MKKFALVFLFLSTSAYAEDKLIDLMPLNVACNRHVTARPNGVAVFEPGFEHCTEIQARYNEAAKKSQTDQTARDLELTLRAKKQ